jgi:CPA1 family monovalent cation:H+ antiporter
MLSAYGDVIVTLITKNFINVADARNPALQTPLILGWTGMRGVVSLAATLSIPVYLSNGTLFPLRSLILFVTFIVILTTLLVQGLTLPVLISKIKIPDFRDYLSEEEADVYIQMEMSKHALHCLHEKYDGQWENSCVLQQLAAKWEGRSSDDAEVVISGDSRKIYLDLLEKQRQWLIKKNDSDEHMDEDVIRKHLRLIDIEEEKIRSF